MAPVEPVALGGPQRDYGSLEVQLGPPATYYIYIDITGARWLVLDCVMIGGQFRRSTPTSPRTTCRIFLARAGLKRYYGRQPHEVWERSPETCLRQLRASTPTNDAFADDKEINW